MKGVEPIFVRSPIAARLNTSPDQYDVSGKIGSFSPRFTIKRRHEEKPVVDNIDFVGRLDAYIMPRSPRYTIGSRHEPMFDPTGNNGPSYVPPAFGSQATRIVIGKRLPDKKEIEEELTKKEQKEREKFKARYAAHQREANLMMTMEEARSKPGIKIPDLPPMPKFNHGRRIVDGEPLRPNFAAVKPRVPIHEPEMDLEKDIETMSARRIKTRGLKTANRSLDPNELLNQCGPVGKAEFRYIRNLDSGPKYTIGNRIDNLDLIAK